MIQIEQHRALHQNAAKVYPRDFRGSELPLIVRSSSGCKLLKLNRQIPELEHHVTYRKQTTETCSNRQKNQKRPRPISKSTSFLSARDFARTKFRDAARPTLKNEFLQTGCTTSTRFWSKSRRYRKQMIKPFLPGVTTACRETGSTSNFQISAAFLYNKLRSHRKAPRAPSQSSKVSRTYGRS